MALAKMAEERPWIKKTQRKDLSNLVEAAEKWFVEKNFTQASLANHEDPVLISDQVYAKLRPITTMTSDLLKSKETQRTQTCKWQEWHCRWKC
jgi:hypothetical protein